MDKLMRAIGLPVALLALAIGFSALMRWLETFVVGVVIQCALLLAILAWVAHIGWTYNDGNDDA